MQPGCFEQKHRLQPLAGEEIADGTRRNTLEVLAADNPSCWIVHPSLGSIRRGCLKIAKAVNLIIVVRDSSLFIDVGLIDPYTLTAQLLEGLTSGGTRRLGESEHDAYGNGAVRSWHACIGRFEKVLSPNIIRLIEEEQRVLDFGPRASPGKLLEEIFLRRDGAVARRAK